jgi:putative nucleotidyltransferase with HDIG domain
MNAATTSAAPLLAPEAAPAGDLVLRARALERAGRLGEALAVYQVAIAKADVAQEPATLAEALRRLAVVRHRRGESAEAQRLCHRSYSVALGAGLLALAGEALNTLGGIAMETGVPDEARHNFIGALALGEPSGALRARVEQNLGILANIQGDFDDAVVHYARSLEAYRAVDDEHGCALAYHNLGMASTDRERFDDAEGYFRQSRAIAERVGDAYLKGLCLVNHAKVHLARERYEHARESAEAALLLFDRVGVTSAKADAYRVLGMMYRETGRAQLAEARLTAAIELAGAAGCVLNEAEASRELALLYQAMGRNQEALRLLNVAHRLFERVDARVALVNVDGRKVELEATYLGVVREWGQSIESRDSYTFGHCERVAQYAVAVAQAAGLDEQAQTAVRLGAYLHDLGKVRVPHEILNKPGPLTQDEFAVVQRHPVWGLEMLADVQFPWDIKPIIRWHHERWDGTGYPDGLRGDQIPRSAQIVGIVDFYDALTTDRPYRPARSHDEALAALAERRHWWSEEVYGAFLMAAVLADRAGEQSTSPSLAA